MEQISRWAVFSQWVLVSLVFLVFVFFLPFGTHPVFFNKHVLIVILLCAALVLHLGHVITTGILPYRKGLLLGYGFLGAVLLTGLFAPVTMHSFWGMSGGEVDSIINIISFFVFFFLITHVLQEKYIPYAVWSYGMGVGILLVLALFQFLGIFLPFEFAQAQDFTVFGSVLGLALLCGATILLITGMLVYKKFSRFEKIGLVVLAGACALYLIVLGSLVTIIWILLAGGIAVLLGLYLYSISKQGSTPLERSALFRTHGHIVNALLVVLTLSIFFSIVSLPLARISNAFSFDLPYYEAEHTLRSSAENMRVLGGVFGVKDFSFTALKNIMLGSGPAHYGYEYLSYRGLPVQNESSELRAGQGYSLVGTYLVSLGVIATLLFLVCMFSLLRKFFAAYSWPSEDDTSLLPVLLPVLVLGVASFFVLVPGYAALILFFGALGLAAREVLPRHEIDIFAKPQYVVVVSPLAILILVGVIVGSYTQVSRAIASGYYARGVRAANAGDFNKGLEHMGAAISWDSQSDTYYRGAADLLGVFLRGGNATNEQLQSAIALGKKSVELNPREPENYLALARIHETLLGLTLGSAGQREKSESAYMIARQAYESALALDPQNRSLYERLAELHGAAGHGEEAQEVLGKLVERDPEYLAAYFMAARLALQSNMPEVALTHATTLKERVPGDAGMLFELGLLYYNNERLEEAEKELLGALVLLPEYSNARYYLGLIYDKQNKRAKALEQFEAVQKLNPDNKDIAAIIENLRKGKPAITTGDL